MLETAFYLVTRDIALRSGLIDSRHRVKDGRFVLNDRDLARIRLSTDEYVSGLNGIEKITNSEAKELIKENKYALGDVKGTQDTKEGQEYEETQEEEKEE